MSMGRMPITVVVSFFLAILMYSSKLKFLFVYLNRFFRSNLYVSKSLPKRTVHYSPLMEKAGVRSTVQTSSRCEYVGIAEAENRKVTR